MSSTSLNRRFCVAPMLDCTDRHQRFLARLLSKHAMLYTEMVTTGAIIYGDKGRHLDFSLDEQPVALQLGGSEPSAMAECAEIAQEWGYNEININVGCPSDRVQSGSFGACLMQTPNVVADNVRAMTSVVDIPITVKCRIGVDDQEPRNALWELVSQCAQAGCTTFLVHARKAWLSGLSPKENRDVPPLDYPLVYELKQSFPELEIILNGGITSLDQCLQHLDHLDGVMMGREAYSNPFVLAGVDKAIFTASDHNPTRDHVLAEYIDYAEQQLEHGARLNHLARHIVGLFHGEPRSRIWRRHISENAHRPGSDVGVLQDAYQAMITC